MKQQDFDRLKAKLGDEFEAYNNEYGVVIVEKKKDIWEGVEYMNVDGRELKIKEVLDLGFMMMDGSFTGKNYKGAKPSTESAYVNQLKKEAFERFGEIKDGDRFDVSELGSSNRVSGILLPKKVDFTYYKACDTLELFGFRLYSKGKWATRFPKRIEVVFGWTEKKIALMKTPVALFTNKSTEKSIFDGKTDQEICDIFTFLSNQLEKYLNNELE